MDHEESTAIERPPIVVVMGHVDHGKSTLLDFIRKSNTVEKEFGGITQHVAAYEVEHLSKDTGTPKRITFIDTPGHAAFRTIRSRGANIADIAILVVAADDGVKAQTLEALQSIREAGIPFIVAINKIDKPNADISRTQASLLEKEVYLEKFGGDVPWAAISAKAGTGVSELLDLILLVAEIESFTANPSPAATGYVIEAHRDQKRGIAATLIITNGTLKSGMAVVAGSAVAPVRIMENHAGATLKQATFSTPISLVGFDELPEVGASFSSYDTKREAEAARIVRSSTRAESISDPSDTRFLLPVIIRADTTGSLEAIASELSKIGDEYTGIALVQSGIGTISENDVKSALAGKIPALVLGFNVETDPIAATIALQQGLPLQSFTIIYKLTEYLADVLTQKAPKRSVEHIVGKARVLKQFSSQKEMHLVGGSVLEGALSKNATIHVLRKKELVGDGVIITMQANRQDTSKVEAGTEFGAHIEALFPILPGDTLECFTTTEQ